MAPPPLNQLNLKASSIRQHPVAIQRASNKPLPAAAIVSQSPLQLWLSIYIQPTQCSPPSPKINTRVQVGYSILRASQLPSTISTLEP